MSDPRLPYGFIVGSGYSGSTVLALLLGTHPELVTVGEMGPAGRWQGVGLPCSCGETVASCPFFQAVSREAGADVDLDRGTLRLGSGLPRPLRRLVVGSLGLGPLERLRDRAVDAVPAIRAERRAFAARTAAFARAAVARSGARGFVDATKNRLHLAALLGEPTLDVRVIHLVRDPRAFAASALRNAGVPARRAARAWRREQEGVARLLDRHPALPVARVRYEDLCAAPGDVAMTLHRLLGVAPVAPPDVVEPRAQHVIGNRTRLSDRLVIRCDERWTRDLSAADRAAVERVAWPAAERLGYPR